MNATCPVAPSSRARDSCPKNSSTKVVRGAVVGSSGVMARAKDVRRGYSHPGTHVAERKPAEFSLLLFVLSRMSTSTALVEWLEYSSCVY